MTASCWPGSWADRVTDAAEAWSRHFRAPWPDAVAAYEEVLAPSLFVPWATSLLDEVAVAPGERVLDVATGPGTVARLAAARVGPTGRVTGCDLSPSMLDRARARPPVPGGCAVEYRESPAAPLDAASAGYDVVTCQHGLQFFPDRPAALAEMHRGLVPGGRLGLAVWSSIEESPAFAGLARALASVAGAEVAEQYRGGPWGLTDAGALAALVGGAGFTGVAVRHRCRTVTFEGGPGRLLRTLAVTAVGPVVAQLDADGQQRLAAAVEAELAPLVERGAVRTETAALVVVATRPPAA